MSSRASSTLFPLVRTYRAPSPSTRASSATDSTRSFLWDIATAAAGEVLDAERLAECFGEIAGEPHGQAGLAIGALIGDADLHPAVPADRGDHGWLAGRAALQRVGQQAGEDPGEERGVGDHVGQVLGRAQRDALAARPQVVQAGGHHLVEV